MDIKRKRWLGHMIKMDKTKVTKKRDKRLLGHKAALIDCYRSFGGSCCSHHQANSRRTR